MTVGVDFASLYEQYHKPIFKYIYRHTGGSYLAEDFAAEVFVRAFDATQRDIGAHSEVLAWLYRIARNLILDHNRRSQHLQFVPLDDLTTTLDEFELDREFERNRLREGVNKALLRATDDQREVILLRMEGYEHKEIASRMGRSEMATKALTHRAFLLMSVQLREFVEHDRARISERMEQAVNTIWAILTERGPMTITALATHLRWKREQVQYVLENAPNRFVVTKRLCSGNLWDVCP